MTEFVAASIQFLCSVRSRLRPREPSIQAHADNPGPSDSSRAARALSRLVLVRPGELRALAWSWSYFFCLLMSYYMLRPVREAMGITRGHDKLAWLMTGTLLAMLVANPIFARLVARRPRRVFIPASLRFFAGNIVLFFLLLQFAPEGWRVGVGYAFYIWLSVFNLFVVSVFWALMADGHTPEQGRRLFGFIGVGGTLGAIAGASTAWQLASEIGSAWLMLVAAPMLEAAAWCARRAMRELERRRGPLHAAAREPTRDALAGLKLLCRSRSLLIATAYMLVWSCASTLLYIEQGRIVQARFPDERARTTAFASLDLAVNLLTLLTQLFLTGRLIRWIGLTGALVLPPVISIAGFSALWGAPAILGSEFATLFVFQVSRRGLHYAIDRPAREALYTPLGPDEKYKSKCFIDTFVYRAGDMIGGWAPSFLSTPALAPAAMGTMAAWLALSVWIGALGDKETNAT